MTELKGKITPIQNLSGNVSAPAQKLSGNVFAIPGNLGAAGATPVFDLASLGMTAIPVTGGVAALETDITEICAALDKGSAMFVIPFDLGGMTINATLLMNSASTNGAYQCISVVNYVGPSVIEVVVGDGAISVSCSKMLDFAGVPAYVEDYIGSALEGDY